jgi:hypothetical protein
MDPNHKIAPDEYDAIRTKVADFIMKLFPAAGEQNPEPAEWLRLQPAPLEADAYAEATVAECLQALNCGSVKQKRQAAGALAMRDADEILSARDRITGLLDDPMICMVALRALAKMGSEAASAIPHIDKLLNSNDVFVREAAI